MVDSAKVKTPQGIVLIVCLLLAIIGAAVLGGEKSAGWESACAVFCVVFLLLYVLFSGLVFVVVALAIMLQLSPGFVAAADSASKVNNDDAAAGYSLMIIGMWLGFIAIAVNFGLDIVKKIFGAVNIPAIVITIINFIGCIILWACDFPAISTGIFAMLNGILFLVAVTKPSPVSMWINIFASAYFQVGCLGGGISEAESARSDDALIAGYCIVWIAHILMIAYHIWNLSGGGIAEAQGKLKAVFCSIRGIILIVCIILCIVGAIIYKGQPGVASSSADSTRWLFANHFFIVLILIWALLQSGDRQCAYALVSCGILMATQGDLVGLAKLWQIRKDFLVVSESDANQNTIGVALVIIADWLAFLAYGLSQRIQSAPGSIKSGGIFGIVRLVAFVFILIGLICWWAYTDKTFGTDIQLSITTLLTIVFIFAAYWMQDNQFIKHVAMFFATQVCILQLSRAVSIRNGPAPNEDDLNTGVAGITLCWLGFVALIGLYCIEGASSGEGEGEGASGASGAAAASGAAPAPKVVSPQPQNRAVAPQDPSAPPPAYEQPQPHEVVVHTEKV